MKVLVACEESGRVRDEFLRRGHDAVSLDLLPTSSPGPHRQEPLTPEVLTEGWDLVVAFPPCTRLSCVGARYWAEWQANGEQAAGALFVQMIWESPCPKIAIENPVGWLNTNWRKPNQIIDPWMFGDNFLKKTCLWLRGLPLLLPEVLVKPDSVEYWITGQRRSDGKVDPRGRHYRSGTDRARQRSKTFPGIARAMAETWG